MKKTSKQSGKIMLIPAVLFLVLFTCISVSAFEVITPGSFWLEAENQGKHNRIDLEWEAGTDVFYTIYQSEDGGVNWQTRSSQYGKDIRVLNVYPRDGADQLKIWMETNGYGEGHISVDTVLQEDYNLKPETYLKDSVKGEYQYDVVVFGFWDENGRWSLDISDDATAATEEYIKSGYGVLFGHDTATYAVQSQGSAHDNFVYLAEKYTNIEAAFVGTGEGQIPRIGSDKIKSINNGFLLQYPHNIEYGGVFTIPASHGYGQIANGIVWMEFTDLPAAGSNSGPVISSEKGGTNNFYLTTWNNTAMIQTGHTSGTSNPEEQMVIANVLMYLAQYTEEKTAEDQSANDTEPPETPEAVWGSNVKDLTISAKDQGTPFWYKVEATKKHAISDVKTSDIVKEYCTTGIYGYYVIEDKNSYLDFDESTAVFYPADTLEQLDYTLSDVKNYLHVKAVDYNGNVSDAARFSLYDNDMSFQITKEIDELSELDQDFVFKLEYRTQAGQNTEEIFYGVVTVPAGSLTGVTDFDNILPGIYTVSELDGNWKYELKTGVDRTQTLALTDPLDNQKEVAYWNEFQLSSWIAGQGKAINKLK